MNFIEKNIANKERGEVKQRGSEHYKTGGIEPIDLYESAEMLQDFSLASIIKYAFRCRRTANRTDELMVKDLTKIIHYAEIVIALITKTAGANETR